MHKPVRSGDSFWVTLGLTGPGPGHSAAVCGKAATGSDQHRLCGELGSGPSGCRLEGFRSDRALRPGGGGRSHSTDDTTKVHRFSALVLPPQPGTLVMSPSVPSQRRPGPGRLLTRLSWGPSDTPTPPLHPLPPQLVDPWGAGLVPPRQACTPLLDSSTGELLAPFAGCFLPLSPGTHSWAPLNVPLACRQPHCRPPGDRFLSSASGPGSPTGPLGAESWQGGRRVHSCLESHPKQ